VNAEFGKSYTINQVGSMYTMFFTEKEVTNFESAKTSDTALFGKYFNEMLNRGVYLAPSQYESLFVSDAITQTEIDHIITSHRESLTQILE
jgi:glutamate-1-semialdehyde 2,1-aminomutase